MLFVGRVMGASPIRLQGHKLNGDNAVSTLLIVVVLKRQCRFPLAGRFLLAMQIDFTGNFQCFLFENGIE